MATRRRTARARRRGRPLGEYQAKRDFTRTAEPKGGTPRSGGDASTLQFVIQKHAASHLHYDLRLELDGVMKSWAVPKGPSLDPSRKHLAVEVEDHPIEYNTFEGTIPAGEYGGGTVMLWDRGTYEADDGDVDDLRRGHERGNLKVKLHGERLDGSFGLVRMRDQGASKPQWLLIKHRDADAVDGWDITDYDTSVATGRTMDEIANGTRTWTRKDGDSDKSRARPKGTSTSSRKSPATRNPLPATRVTPMLASIGTDIPSGDEWTFEPKYDGVRVLAFASGESVRLITRNGKDKAHQFPEVTAGVLALGRRRQRPFVLDGEIVAFVGDSPARFQALQGRLHVKDAGHIAGHATSTPSALVAFDLLVDGDDVLVTEPWTTRRRRLERLIGARPPRGVRLGDTGPGDGRRLLARARRDDWEGIIAKRTSATYQPGVRSRDWLKLKVEFRQEFVVGGYTEPRNSREHLGALLLGYYDGDDFVYVGHTGGGFTHEGLAAMARRLRRLARQTSPFSTKVPTNETPHWVRPEVVVEVKFNEWTADNRLRQPIFLGIRDDKDAREVTRENASVQRNSSKRGRRAVTRKRDGAAAKARGGSGGTATATRKRKPRATGDGESLEAELATAEGEGRSASLTLGRGVELTFSNLAKVWFPGRAGGFTKGDVLRHYVRMEPFILSAMADRPLVLKRFPDGITGEAFYQQKAPQNPPNGVRVDTIEDAGGERVDRLVGGTLATLLYQVQLGTISVDPWHSRVDSLEFADYSVIDLDPGPRATFERVVEVATFVREELDELGLRGALKTSGASGLHVFLPLPPRTSNESALLVAQLVATRVAMAHPKESTIERTVSARPKSSVYVDYLQNILGKSVAAAYAVRARPGATVSTPLEWNELSPSLDPRDFTIETVPERFARVGDIWARAMKERNTAVALKALT